MAFLNPFYIYSVIWTTVLVFYSLGWSAIYSPLKPGLLVFFCATIAISAVLGARLQGTLNAIQTGLVVPNSRSSARLTALIVFGYMIQFVYVGQVPLVNNLVLHTGYKYGDFPGIPVFGVILVTLSIFHAAMLAYGWSRSSGRRWRSYAAQFLIVELMFILLLNRGAFMLCVFMAALIFLSNAKVTGRRLAGATVVALTVMFVFGCIGNLRFGLPYSDNSYMLKISRVSDSYPTFIPDQFLWSYMYLVSPLGNLNGLVNTTLPTYDVGSTLVNLIPDFIVKRAFPSFDPSTSPAVNYFNASTGFASAWKFNGYAALWGTYAALVGVVLATIKIVKESWKTPVLAVSCGVVSFMFFTNALSYSGVSFALAFPVIGSLLVVRQQGSNSKRELDQSRQSAARASGRSDPVPFSGSRSKVR